MTNIEMDFIYTRKKISKYSEISAQIISCILIAKNDSKSKKKTINS